MPDPLFLSYAGSSKVSAVAPSGPAASSSAPRAPPDVLTYSYASRLVYVAPAETYDQAIDLAKESFLELKDVDRERISLGVHAVLKNHQNQQGRKTAEIGRTAWSAVVASLARFEIIEIRVASAPRTGKAALTLSSSQDPAVEPPPYVSEKGWYSDSQADSQTNLALQMSSSKSQSSSFATRVVNLLTPKSSRRRLSP